MATYLLDTSALFKHYLPEPGAERVDALLTEDANVLVSAATEVEFLSNLQRLLTVDRVIDRDQFEAVCLALSLELASGRIEVVPVSAGVVEASVQLLLSRYVTPIDALQLATLESLGAEAVLVSADQKLNRLADKLGLRFSDPCGEEGFSPA